MTEVVPQEHREEQTRAPARKKLFRYDIDSSFYDKEVLDALRVAESKKREEAEKIRKGEMQSPGWEVLDNRYRRLYGLDAGGMGAVDLALDEQTGRLLVVKRILPEMLENKAIATRFLREIKALAKTGENPFIVNAHDVVDMPDGGKALVMEYVKDPDLYERLKKMYIPTDEFAASVAMQVCLALDGAHAQGVIHRDLKSDNIFVHSGAHPEHGDVHVRVGDFGVAQLDTVDAFTKTPPHGTARDALRAGGNAEKRLTGFGYVVGTVDYLAPESITDQKYDRRSDLYSLGVVMYRMIAGRLPFKSKDVNEILRMHREEAPYPPHEVRPDHVESPLEPIVMKLLAKDPKERYQTAMEVARSIKDAMTARDPTFAEKEPFAGLPVASGVGHDVLYSKEA